MSDNTRERNLWQEVIDGCLKRALEALGKGEKLAWDEAINVNTLLEAAQKAQNCLITMAKYDKAAETFDKAMQEYDY